MNSHHPLPNRGVILLLALVFLGVFTMVSAALLGSLNEYAKSERFVIAEIEAQELAEAGFDQAVYGLDQDASYSGETTTALGSGVFTTVVSAIDGTTTAERITSSGYIPDAVSPVATKTITGIVNQGTSSWTFVPGSYVVTQ